MHSSEWEFFCRQLLSLSRFSQTKREQQKIPPKWTVGPSGPFELAHWVSFLLFIHLLPSVSFHNTFNKRKSLFSYIVFLLLLRFVCFPCFYTFKLKPQTKSSFKHSTEAFDGFSLFAQLFFCSFSFASWTLNFFLVVMASIASSEVLTCRFHVHA